MRGFKFQLLPLAFRVEPENRFSDNVKPLGNLQEPKAHKKTLKKFFPLKGSMAGIR